MKLIYTNHPHERFFIKGFSGFEEDKIPRIYEDIRVHWILKSIMNRMIILVSLLGS